MHTPGLFIIPVGMQGEARFWIRRVPDGTLPGEEGDTGRMDSRLETRWSSGA